MVGTVHGVWCNTRTFRATCRGCSAGIFVFMCDCGSRVLFDALGQPWPVHDCDTSWTRGLVRTTHPDGSISVQLKSGIAIIRPAAGFAVESSTLSRLQRKVREDSKPPIQAIEPSLSGRKELVGALREIARNADPLKAFDLPDTAMTWAMLGKRWENPVGRITVHSDDGLDNQLGSYTAWIPARFLGIGIERGIAVALSLVSERLPNGKIAWFCAEFEPLG